MKKFVYFAMAFVFTIVFLNCDRYEGTSELDEAPRHYDGIHSFKFRSNIKLDDLVKKDKFDGQVLWADSYWPLDRLGLSFRYANSTKSAGPTHPAGPVFDVHDYYKTYIDALKSNDKVKIAALSPAEKYDYISLHKLLGKNAESHKNLASIIPNLEKTKKSFTKKPREDAKKIYDATSGGLVAAAFPMTSEGWSEWSKRAKNTYWTFAGEDGRPWKWMGHCHGWAAASAMVEEPKHAVGINLDGKEIVFFEGDIRGLQTKIWAQNSPGSEIWAGGRCEIHKKKVPLDRKNRRIVDGVICERNSDGSLVQHDCFKMTETKKGKELLKKKWYSLTNDTFVKGQNDENVLAFRMNTYSKVVEINGSVSKYQAIPDVKQSYALPVIRDTKYNVEYKLDSAGNIMHHANGLPIIKKKTISGFSHRLAKHNNMKDLHRAIGEYVSNLELNKNSKAYPQSYISLVYTFDSKSAMESFAKNPDFNKKATVLMLTGCRNVNPVTWHLALSEHLNDGSNGKGRPFVFDQTPSADVWNQPVFGYKSDIAQKVANKNVIDILNPPRNWVDPLAELRAKNTRYLVDVETEVFYMAEPNVPSVTYTADSEVYTRIKRLQGTKDKDVSHVSNPTFKYTLEFDSGMRLIGGEWGHIDGTDRYKEENMPDFIYGYHNKNAEPRAKRMRWDTDRSYNQKVYMLEAMKKIHQCSIKGTPNASITIGGKEIKYVKDCKI